MSHYSESVPLCQHICIFTCSYTYTMYLHKCYGVSIYSIKNLGLRAMPSINFDIDHLNKDYIKHI